MNILSLVWIPALFTVMIPNAEAMGGKKTPEPALPSGFVSAVGNHSSAQPVDPALAFANWCQSHLGRLSPDQARCVTELNYRYSKKPHSEVWNSDVRVARNDTVSFLATGSPKPLIGLEVGTKEGDSRFVAAAEGKLAFSAPGKGRKFSVTQVQVRRCFDSSGTSVQCAEDETTAESNPRKGSEGSRRKQRSATSSSRRLAS